MVDKAPAQDAAPTSNLKMAGSKPAGNPALRMMGLPNFKFKLPSRNWLIFWAITGSFTSTLLYDRYHKKRAQQKWCNFVSHLADEPLPPTTLPRKITIFLAAPPGDSIRAAREHFHEYIKPILVSGALDWEVVEGRREGEVRAGLAEKIRKLRRRNGEQSESDSSEEGPKDESREQLMHELRQQTGIKEWDGIQGDLILGRHTWKEYIRGLHEGWLGPLSQRQLPSQPSQTDDPSLGMSSPDLSSTEHSTESSSQEKPIPEESPAPNPQPTKPSKSTPAPPYISPAEYSSRSVSPTLNGPLNPSLPLPLPHVLGFFNTPTRLYRFLTRRQLADSTGRSVAALVLATHSRPYGQSADYVSAIDPDESSPSAASDRGTDSVVLAKEAWEQEVVLKQEEKEWHKSVWKPNAEGDEEERVWQVPVIVDSRIGQRMREFDLANGEDENAARVDAQKRLEADTSIQQFCKWIGWTEQKKKGWEMGLEGDENE